jgi:citrate lyase subunit beta/citryl-CoA lyase
MIFDEKKLNELQKILDLNEKEKALKLIDYEKKIETITTHKRSALMVSGHNLKHLNKLDELKCDIVMLNLEDGVPADKKEMASIMIAIFLTHMKSYEKEIVVRVNALDEGGVEEMIFLNQFSLNAFRIPKVKSIEELKGVFCITTKDIHLSIETKEAFFNIKEFSHNRIKTLYFGILDLFADLKIDQEFINKENLMIHKLLIDFSLNCKYIGVNPIGFVYQHYKDLDGFRDWCKFQKSYGFEGVGAITPAQIEIANEIFIPKSKEFAKMIVERFEKDGNFTIDGLFVDEPIYKNYLNIVNEL